MANIPWIVRLVRDGMPDDPSQDPTALALSAPTAERATTDCIALLINRGELSAVALPDRLEVDCARQVSINDPTTGKVLVASVTVCQRVSVRHVN